MNQEIAVGPHEGNKRIIEANMLNYPFQILQGQLH